MFSKFELSLSSNKNLFFMVLSSSNIYKCILCICLGEYLLNLYFRYCMSCRIARDTKPITMAAPDEKLRWLETRINSSLHPRNEDLKHMMQNDENR